MSEMTHQRAREIAWRKFGFDAELSVGQWVREARSALHFLLDAANDGDETEQHVAELTQACADLDIAIEDLAAERDRYLAALQAIARGTVPPPKEGHYLAHREAVRLAREALSQPKE